MPFENFKEALEFVVGDKYDVQVGIIGGEPTLYSHINEALELAMSNERVFPVTLYTNAVTLERIRPELLENRKFRMLVNVNSPEDMGQAKYEKMCRNINDFIYEHIGAGRFKLSVNLYKPDFDYSYVMDLVREFRCDNIRLSVSVPSRSELGKKDALTHFREMKPLVIEVTKKLAEQGVIAGFDCNFMPMCLLTEEEKEQLFQIKHFFMRHLEHSENFWMRSIISEIQTCSPVVDILPNLTSVRCFGLSEYTKVNIRDFKNIEELEEYYYQNIDRKARDFYTSEECKNCFMRRNRKCSSGCLTYKMEQILAASEAN